MMFGKLANIGDDIGDDFLQGSQVSVFKKIVTGNRIKAERKGQDPFEFNPFIKLLFSANDIPRMKDKTGAVLRRLVIIPFNATFSKDDPDYDPFIKYKLIQQESVEYFIRLGVEGLKRIIINDGFTKSDKVQNQLTEYEEENNPTNDGRVAAYYGEAGFSTTGKLTQAVDRNPVGTESPDENLKFSAGTIVQVMVEQPKFYYKVVPLKTEKRTKGAITRKIRYYVSDTPKAGFKLHPAFIVNGQENDVAYLAAFEGSLWDASASAYILDDSQVADFAADMLCSIANAKPLSGLTQNATRANIRKLAEKRGTGWEQGVVQTAWYKEVQQIEKRPYYYLAGLQWMLQNHLYKTSEYATFTKKDGKKEREIYKLPFFPDRIAQWAVLQVIEPQLLAYFTDDTYSATPNKGIHAAYKKLRLAVDTVPEEMTYCLKIDCKKFYPSIDHETLKQKFRRKYKDPELLELIDEVIDSISTCPATDENIEFYRSLAICMTTS